MKSRTVDGRRVYAEGPTEAIALEKLEKKLSHTLSTEEETLHEFAKRVWYPEVEILGNLTRLRYRSVYRKHIKDRIGQLPIRAINKPAVQSFVFNLIGDGVGGPTIRYIIERLSRICTLAIDHELLDRNPCLRLSGVPKRTPKRHRALPLEQAVHVLDSVPRELSAPVFLALFLGLRRGEIAGLKWEDLDRQKGELKISRQRQAQVGKGVVEAGVKSDSGRVLRLTREIIRQIDERGDLDSLYVCTRNGEPWVPNRITKEWDKVRVELGLEEWTFHDLRHGAAGLLFATGSDLLQIASVLGHKKPDMSFQYTSLTKTNQAKSLENLSKKLSRHKRTQ